MRRPAVKIFIPDALKSILVDDWEKVTKENKVAPTPAPISVTQFLNEYEESEMAHRRPGSADADILEEVIAGVKEYFNKALGRILLYRFERNLYFDWHKQLEKGHGDHAGKTLCDIYGCEHLLRLFGKILAFVQTAPVSTSNSSHSSNARPSRTHQHGRPSRQPTPRGTLKDDAVARKAHRALPVDRLRARRPGLC
jgi:hypothetical protein